MFTLFSTVTAAHTLNPVYILGWCSESFHPVCGSLMLHSVYGEWFLPFIRLHTLMSWVYLRLLRLLAEDDMNSAAADSLMYLTCDYHPGCWVHWSYTQFWPESPLGLSIIVPRVLNKYFSHKPFFECFLSVTTALSVEYMMVIHRRRYECYTINPHKK